MTDHDQASRNDRQPPVSDETLRRYLLGSLDQPERLRLDELLLIDDEFAERVQLAESALTDDYAIGRLSRNEIELFKSKFLVTQTRQESVRVSMALSDHANSHPAVVAKQSWREKITGFLAFDSSRAPALVGAFAVLILLVGVVWLVAKHQREAPPLIAKNEPVPASSPAVVSPESPSQTAKPTPLPSPPSVENATPATVATFVLLPGALRSGGDMTRIAIPGGERDVLRLSLVVESPTEDTYQAELSTAEGQKVLVRPNLRITRNGHAKIVLTVPVRLLHTRDYQIKLTHQKPDGQSESAGRYYFRAQEE